MASVATDNESISLENADNQAGEALKNIGQLLSFLKKAAANFDNRYISKVFRDLVGIRKELNHEIITSVILSNYANKKSSREFLVKAVGQLEKDTMEVDESSEQQQTEMTPEEDLFLHLLAQLYLLDNNRMEELDELNGRIIELMGAYNRRMLDFIQAKIWFYICRTKELRGDLYSVRPALLMSLRTATLRHDSETQASIITLLLRNYLLTHDITQASNLVEKTVFPENASNSLSARYFYYLARINAIQLDYSSALSYVLSAVRKAPQTSMSTGFVQSATKLSIIVELLTGDIPELKSFENKQGNFEPYFMVCKAVRLGDLKIFENVLKQYESVFVHDDNFTLVSRLRQNVIKTGIRIISLSYSKISLRDICIKLHLDSEELTEYIVAKAIRDGVIEATINHEKGFMKSKELLNVYSTTLPQSAFDQRIQFCLSLYNDNVKSMRYPSDENKPDLSKYDLESKEDELDILKAIEEGDLDDFLD